MTRQLPRLPRLPRLSRLRGLAAPVGLLAALLVLAGCTAPRPDVTFYGNRHDVQTGPALWCTVDDANLTFACPEQDDASFARLSLRAGQGVQISVGAEIGDTPWVVYVQYRSADGTEDALRTAFFTDGELSATVHPPEATDQLLRVEVQAGLILTATADGSGVDYTSTRSWVLLVDPEAEPSPDEGTSS
ncbi:DUF2771 family protein [Nakamurella sp. YIM 132087]|uniref:DUF2771 family protein n=1 Tax=Nakamurella alba TaxID=2665158 RepID=A0A7K1FS74_9ACTN|nr:DUF2771 family protein [Nakamurella alba]MTD16986.1 DUF2771 family protein [Nakamurella alba]